MAILSSGSGSLRLSVPVGSSLIIRNFSGTETVTGSSVAREDATSRLGAGAYVYGPQTSASTLTISTTGTLDYQVVAGDPTPSVGASGFTLNATTGLAETEVEGETFVSLPTDLNGNAKAIVIGRSATLAGLVALTANEGEVAVATDEPALVRFGATQPGNAVFTNEVVINVGVFTYVAESAGYGWFSGVSSIPTFNLPPGVRRVVLTSTRVDKGVHPDITTSTGFILKISALDIVRTPTIEIVCAAKLDVGGCEIIGVGSAILSKTDVSSSAYWPPVMRVVTSLAFDAVAPIITYPTSVASVSQAVAHSLIIT